MSFVHSEVFVCARCRLYRRSDAKILNAWVQFFTGSSFIVTTEDTCKVEVGEQYYIEAFGPGVKACLDAKLVQHRRVQPSADGVPEKRGLSFELDGYVQINESDEEARHLTTGMSAEMKFGSMTLKARVRDISRQGVGIVAEEPWDVGMPVELKVNSPLGQIHLAGTVRHSSPFGQAYRVGIELSDFSRVDGSRWKRLLSDAA